MNAALIGGGVLVGVWGYDQIAGKIGWPTIWSAIFGNPTLVNYAFDELWLLLVGLVLILLALRLR